MTILDPSGLETDTYDMTGWVHIFNKNIDRLNRLLLKIQALGDVDPTYIKHGAMLTWSDSESSWIPRIYGRRLVATTLPTTTSTTVTTTTSTTNTTTTTTTSTTGSTSSTTVSTTTTTTV